MFPGGGNTSTLAYDIQATSERQFTESQCKAALQALLADRFKLAAHWEAKEAEVSDLVVARGGPKMQRAAAADQERGFITINGKAGLDGSRRHCARRRDHGRSSPIS